MIDEPTQSESDTTTAAPAPKRSMKAVGVIAAGLLAGGGFGAFVAGPQLATRLTAPGTTVVTSKAGEHGAKGVRDSAGASTESAVHVVDNLVLNPAGTSGLRFLLVSVGLQLSDPATADALKSRDPEVRDVLLRVFGSKRVDELADMSRREGYKHEIKVAIDSMLARSVVKGVFLPQFVIQ